MVISYDKLWNKLDEQGMKKTDLIKEAKISTNAMAKMGKGEDVRIPTLAKIARVFDCHIDDLLDIEFDEGE